MKHVSIMISTFSSVAAIGIGATLPITLQSGKAFSIVCSIAACILILIALYNSHKTWYHQGRIDVLEKQLGKLEKK